MNMSSLVPSLRCSFDRRFPVDKHLYTMELKLVSDCGVKYGNFGHFVYFILVMRGSSIIEKIGVVHVYGERLHSDSDSFSGTYVIKIRFKRLFFWINSGVVVSNVLSKFFTYFNII